MTVSFLVVLVPVKKPGLGEAADPVVVAKNLTPFRNVNDPSPRLALFYRSSPWVSNKVLPAKACLSSMRVQQE